MSREWSKSIIFTKKFIFTEFFIVGYFREILKEEKNPQNWAQIFPKKIEKLIFTEKLNWRFFFLTDTIVR